MVKDQPVSSDIHSLAIASTIGSLIPVECTLQQLNRLTDIMHTTF